MEKCHFSPFFADYCTELRKIILFLADEGFKNIETDNFAIKISEKAINKRHEDWRSVIRKFLSDSDKYVNNILVYIKSRNNEFNLEELGNKQLLKLYMEIMEKLDDDDNYKVEIGDNENVLLYSISKKTNNVE